MAVIAADVVGSRLQLPRQCQDTSCAAKTNCDSVSQWHTVRAPYRHRVSGYHSSSCLLLQLFQHCHSQCPEVNSQSEIPSPPKNLIPEC